MTYENSTHIRANNYISILSDDKFSEVGISSNTEVISIRPNNTGITKQTETISTKPSVQSLQFSDNAPNMLCFQNQWQVPQAAFHIFYQ